ncbi:glycosyl-transferase for dystroglycan-domain-containing protein [Mycotypha africana]|uniref:glycosyl-transferase for dystroglycan-domain-containing protein n=1 Tax=Mycotypha africana TaxID=64632 RepID=UPI0022FFF054|nr:glycosyl-transferase for dystroglycan-domain-containing protein [Mycotypha africana]KAI8975523.1 glycosyl-transferase for dystroglycan-domain-containing protein [Mycotypha africana]
MPTIPPLTKRVATVTAVLLTIFYIFYFFSNPLSPDTFEDTNNALNSHKQLSDQPIYTRHEGTCSAILCNPVNKCSTWKPNKTYDWSQLSKAGVFRDLAKIQLSPGCELKIKVGGAPPPAKMSTIVDKAEAQDWDEQQVNVNKLDVTMISQFTVNRLNTFAKAIKNWPGPISIAIYLADSTDIDDLLTYFENEDNVRAYAGATIALVKPNYLNAQHLAYPINHLRNIAIAESDTDYIFVVDADFIPSTSLYPIVRSRLIPFILHQGDKMPRTAWVVPCFAIYESYSDLPLPETMEDLRHLVRENIAYITDPGAGHGPTLATEVALVRPLVHGNPLAYEVCYESQWEPYYILHRSAPLYDVRFRNQGGDKQSHALQLNAEKYRFMVLRDTFMIHRDHPTMVWPGGGFEKSQKEAANKWNYFKEYKEEIETLYGVNARWPRGCSAAAIGWQEQRRDLLGIAAGAI